MVFKYAFFNVLPSGQPGQIYNVYQHFPGSVELLYFECRSKAETALYQASEQMSHEELKYVRENVRLYQIVMEPA